jgi:hypothetical protein
VRVAKSTEWITQATLEGVSLVGTLLMINHEQRAAGGIQNNRYPGGNLGMHIGSLVCFYFSIATKYLSYIRRIVPGDTPVLD